MKNSGDQVRSPPHSARLQQRTLSARSVLFHDLLDYRRETRLQVRAGLVDSRNRMRAGCQCGFGEGCFVGRADGSGANDRGSVFEVNRSSGRDSAKCRLDRRRKSYGLSRIRRIY
jgi:hypothetical protein